MVFQEVFQSVLNGCGLDLQQVYQTRIWQELYQSAKALRRTSNASRLDAIQLGPLRFGAKLSGAESVDLGNEWQYDPYVVAAIRFAGEAIQNSAQSCLPLSFPKPSGGLFFRETDIFPRTLPSLVEEWKSGNAERQIYVAELLARTLGNTPDKPTEAADRADQPKERVLPAMYGRFVAKAKHRANCLGKAQLVAAFGKLAGVRMLTAIPVIQTSIEHHICVGAIAEQLLVSVAQHKVELSEARKNCLQAIADFGEDRKRYVSWTHMAIAMQLVDKSWLLVDPNMGLTSVLPDDWQLSEVHSTLQHHRFGLPGLSITKGDMPSPVNEMFAKALGEINCEAVAKIAREVHQANPNRKELVDMLVASEFLDQILKWQNFDKIDLPPNAPRRTKAICVLIEFLTNQSWKENREKKLVPSDKGSGLWFIDVWCNSEDWMYERLTDETAREGFDRMVWQFIIQGLDRFRAKTEWDAYGHRLIHPICQFSLLGPGLAIPTLSHVALDMGLEYAAQMEAILGRHSFDHYRLLYNAAAPLYREPVDQEVTDLSTEILQKLPSKLPNAEIVLEALSQPRTLAVA